MMCEQMITLLRSVNHQCLVLKNNAGEKVYIDLAPVADKLESQQRELAAAKAELAAEREKLEQAEAKLNETYTDEHGTVWTRPTAEAYAKVCKARDNWQQKAEQAEAQCAAYSKETEKLLTEKIESAKRLHRMEEALDEITTDPDFTSDNASRMWGIANFALGRKP